METITIHLPTGLTRDVAFAMVADAFDYERNKVEEHITTVDGDSPLPDGAVVLGTTYEQISVPNKYKYVDGDLKESVVTLSTLDDTGANEVITVKAGGTIPDSYESKLDIYEKVQVPDLGAGKHTEDGPTILSREITTSKTLTKEEFGKLTFSRELSKWFKNVGNILIEQELARQSAVTKKVLENGSIDVASGSVS